MKLVLIRHGESEWNKLNLFTGWTDVELSEKGQEEAKQAGITLKKEGFDFDICYTSFLKRAIHTLNFALASMDREWLPVIKTWKLNERHYGAPAPSIAYRRQSQFNTDRLFVSGRRAAYSLLRLRHRKAFFHSHLLKA